MHLTINRTERRLDGIVGKLYDDDGDFFAMTLERSYGGAPKVPIGTYTCRRGKHRLADLQPFTTFEVLNVPGHTGILFHAGNWHTDSKGCILIGRTGMHSAKGYMITHSRLTMERFMDMLDGVDEFTLTITDSTEV
jgi:hypothetical protein